MHEVLVGRVPLNAQVHSVESNSSGKLQQPADSLACESLQASAERHVPSDVRVQVTVLRQGAEQQTPHRHLQNCPCSVSPAPWHAALLLALPENVLPDLVRTVGGIVVWLQVNFVQHPSVIGGPQFAAQEHDVSTCRTSSLL